MPLYEYRCLGCGRLFERLVRSWNEATSCPACASEQVEKQVSTFAFAGTDGGGSGAPAPGGGGSCCGRGGCGCH